MDTNDIIYISDYFDIVSNDLLVQALAAASRYPTTHAEAISIFRMELGRRQDAARRKLPPL